MARALDTRALPPPDLLIRTSGEQRLSNFLLWECAYAELYFTDVMWPDFGREHLLAAVKRSAGDSAASAAPTNPSRDAHCVRLTVVVTRTVVSGART